MSEKPAWQRKCKLRSGDLDWAEKMSKFPDGPTDAASYACWPHFRLNLLVSQDEEMNVHCITQYDMLDSKILMCFAYSSVCSSYITCAHFCI